MTNRILSDIIRLYIQQLAAKSIVEINFKLMQEKGRSGLYEDSIVLCV